MPIQDELSLADFNMPVTRDLLPGTREFVADSGYQLSELVRAPVWRWEVNFLGRAWQEIRPLIEWLAKVKGSSRIFTLDDPELNRKFTVRLKSGLRIESELVEYGNTALVFEEAIGEAMLEYPSEPSIFFEETDGIAAGSWSSVPDVGRAITGGNSDILRSSTIGNAITWSYGGYGFRLWAAGSGSVDIFLNGVLLTTLSLVGKTFAAPAYTNLSVPPDVNEVRVEHQAAGTVDIDALEFIYNAPVFD
jgi:hypothetical protein